MQKVFEVFKEALNDFPNNANSLDAIVPKLQEITTLISKLQNEYQIEANSIFLYMYANIFNDWYENKIEDLTNNMVQFKATLNSFEENYSQYLYYVDMELQQQDAAWKKVNLDASRLQENIDSILILLQAYIQTLKDIVQEIKLKVPKNHIKQ